MDRAMSRLYLILTERLEGSRKPIHSLNELFAGKHPTVLKNYNNGGEEASFTSVFD